MSRIYGGRLPSWQAVVTPDDGHIWLLDNWTPPPLDLESSAAFLDVVTLVGGGVLPGN